VVTVRLLPGVRAAERQLARLELALMDALVSRLEETHRPALPPPSPAEMMGELLGRSVVQTPSQGERALVEVLVRELVPDEARILAALADGTAYPLLNVDGPAGPLLWGSSSVGRAAGVVLPERVPTYLSHLKRLGLIDIGPERRSLEDEYDILLTDSAVIDAQRRATKTRRIKIRRATVRISELGSAVWAGAKPG
jgi:Abortive infection alpha